MSGETGRNMYLSLQMPADFLYPGLSAVSYSLLLTWLFARSFEDDSKMFYLALVPMLGGFFDYMENIGIVLMLNSFPDLSQTLVNVASTFTVLKSIFMTLFFVFLFVGILSLIIKKMKSNKEMLIPEDDL